MSQAGKSPHCAHSMILLALDKNSRNAMHRQVLNYLSNGQAVIYAAEQDASQVTLKLSNAGEEKAIKKCISTGALTVIDRDEIFNSTNLCDPDRLVRSWISHILKAKRKSRRGSIVTIGTVTAFLQNNYFKKLTEYENKIGKEPIPKGIHAICWYNNPMLFAKLRYSQVLQILNAHDTTIHRGWSYRQWYADTISAYVCYGIDATLGEGSSNLIFKTLRMVYNLDKETIISRPELFEEKLTKIIGEQSAELTFALIADTIRKEMAFSRIAKMQ